MPQLPVWFFVFRVRASPSLIDKTRRSVRLCVEGPDVLLVPLGFFLLHVPVISISELPDISTSSIQLLESSIPGLISRGCRVFFQPSIYRYLVGAIRGRREGLKHDRSEPESHETIVFRSETSQMVPFKYLPFYPRHNPHGSSLEVDSSPPLPRGSAVVPHLWNICMNL